MTYIHDLSKFNADRNSGLSPKEGPAPLGALRHVAAVAGASPAEERLSHLLGLQREHPADREVTALIRELVKGPVSPAQILAAAEHHANIANGRPTTEIAQRAYKGLLEAVRPQGHGTAATVSEPSTPSVTREISKVEAALRSQGRIQDNREILELLGFTGVTPKIPEYLMEQAVKVGGHLVLDTKASLAEYKTAFNEAAASLGIAGRITTALGIDKADLFSQQPSGSPRWLLVPDTVKTGVRGKAAALRQSEQGYLPSPREVVLMLGYAHLEAGSDRSGRLPAFQGKRTFTSQDNTVVGYIGSNIDVATIPRVDTWGGGSLGLADFHRGK
jgi:hypothetical protein